MLMKLLSPEQETVLSTERHWLTQLQIALSRFSAAPEDRAALERSIQQLDELFLLVIVGEFNAGKSAFINALFGQSLLTEGVTPTTTRIQLLKYGAVFQRIAADATVDTYTVPTSFLQEINIVDTPGTNAIQREHEAITQEFIPRADLILFVTSVDRPFTESERAFLERIREWGKKVIIVLNKIDILESPDDIAHIETFIHQNTQALLGFAPAIYPVSAKLALAAKLTGDAEKLAASRMEALERHVFATLDERERIRLKFANPIGVGLHLVDSYSAVVDKRLGILRDDIALLGSIERQLETHQAETRRDLRYRLSDLDNVLYEMEARGGTYFDQVMRLTRLPDLLNKARLEERFKREVVADTSDLIESRVADLTNWLADGAREQWQAVMQHLRQQGQKHAALMVGEVHGSFTDNRARSIEAATRVAQRALHEYNQTAEARRISQSLQQAVANVAVVEVGAVGLGTLITVLATSSAMDVTGILAAGTLAVLGLFLIPARKRTVKGEFHNKIGALRERLLSTLTQQSELELTRSTGELEEAISPYTRFVQSERQNLEDTREEFTTIRQWLIRQQQEIAKF